MLVVAVAASSEDDVPLAKLFLDVVIFIELAVGSLMALCGASCSCVRVGVCGGWVCAVCAHALRLLGLASLWPVVA